MLLPIAAAILIIAFFPGIQHRGFQAAKAVAGSFTGVHPGGFVRACGLHALLVGEAGLLAVGFLLAGSGLLAGVRLGGFPPALRACLAFPVGYGAVSFLLFGLLLARLWFPVVLWSALAIVLVMSLRRAPPRSWPSLPRAGMPSGAAIGAAVSLALFLPWLLGPELHRDAYEYHLAGPWQWLAAHGLAARHVFPTMHFPMLAELPFAFPLMLGHDGVPKLLHLAWFLVGAGAFAAVLPAGQGAWGVLGLTACATVCGIAGNCKNDGVMTALVFLVWACLTATPRPSARSPGVLLAGLLCGFAVSTKHLWPAALAWPVLGSLLVRRRGGWLAGLGAGALLAGTPWAVKSFLITGDPFFIMLSGRFPAIMDGWDARNAAVWGTWFGHRPLLAHPLREYARYLPWENPAFVLALAVAVVGGGSRVLLVGLSLLLSFTCFQVFPGPFGFQAMWFFPVLAPAVFLSFAGWGGIARGRALRWLSGVFVCLAILNRLPVQLQQSNPIPCALGTETAYDLRARTFGTLEEAMEVLRQPHVLAGRAVLSVGEIGSYRVPLPFLVGTPLYSGEAPLLWRLVSSSRSQADLAKKLRQLDVGAILHNPMRAVAMAPRFAPFAWDDRMLRLLERFVARRTEPLLVPRHSDQRNGVFYAYRVLDRTRLPEPAFLFTLPGADILLADGRAAMAVGNYPRAVRLLEPVCRRFPRIGQFRNALAYAYHLAGMPERARSEYAAGLRSGMVDDINILDGASVAFVSGHPEEAAALFSLAADTYPDRAADSLSYLHAARLVAIARRIAAGDAAGAENLIAHGLADARPAAIIGQEASSNQRAELCAARIVALESSGRRADAARELASFRRAYPARATLSLEDLRRLLLSNERIPPPSHR